MAGKTIYTGDMIAALESKIDTMVTTLQAHTTELGNINAAVGNSVGSLNTVASDTLKYSAVHVAKVVAVSAGTDQPLFNLACRCNGVVRIKFKWKISYASNPDVTPYFTINGAKTALAVITNVAANVERDFTADLSVKAGDALVFGLKQSAGTGNLTLVADSVKGYYDLVDIVNDGGVVYGAI